VLVSSSIANRIQAHLWLPMSLAACRLWLSLALAQLTLLVASAWLALWLAALLRLALALATALCLVLARLLKASVVPVLPVALCKGPLVARLALV
jgi:hypothetical protein